MRRGELLNTIAGCGVALLFGLILLEILLRSAPSLIPLAVLYRFTPALREAVAIRLDLPTARTRPRIAASDRSDGGPDIFVLRPHLNVNRADPEDVILGAVEEIQSDPDGFCNLPERAARPAVEVIVIGDSFTWCVGVGPERVASTVLEDLTGLKTLNLGVPGIGPWEYLELYRRYGAKRQPKFVIMNIYEGNDLRDILRFDEFRATGRPHKQEALGGPFAWSYALAFIKAAVEVELRKLRDSGGTDFRYTVEVESRRVAMNVGNADQDELANAYQMYKGKIDASPYEAPLSAFAALAREQGFRPIVAYIPSAYTAYVGSVRFSDETARQALRGASEKQRAWLSANAPRLGLTFIDLVPAFHAAAEGGPLTHFPANMHLTPYGHRVVAQALAEALQDSAAPPTSPRSPAEVLLHLGGTGELERDAAPIP